MIYENSTRLFPDDCIYKDVLGYANLASDSALIASVDFETENAMKGTKCYISLTAEVEASATGTITVEVDNKETSEVLGKSIVKAGDFKGAKEVRVPFYADAGNTTYTLKVTSSISKGGLFAALKYEVG